MSTRRRAFSAHSISQRGAATLVTVMILLLVVAVIGLASLRGALLEQRMSTSVRDRGLAFQAAEAALREGESLAATKPTLPASGCAKGMCAKPDPKNAPVWEDDAVWKDAPETVVTLGDQTVKPKYVLELLTDNVPAKGSCTDMNVIGEHGCSGIERRYRITALSRADGRAEVMLQSIYAVP